MFLLQEQEKKASLTQLPWHIKIEELDPDWNRDQLKEYISGLEVTLPHAVKFFIREVNDEALINLAMEDNYPILRVEDSRIVVMTIIYAINLFLE